MGLAGRKDKQRIGADPRNLTWSDDSSKFGAKYLQSLGWSSGSGLGVSGEGRTSNLKIHQKLDLMGIGANRRGRGGDDAGWRGGREFEGLLARLNQAQTEDVPAGALDEGNAEDHSAEGPLEEEGAHEPQVWAADSKEAKRKRKEDTEKRKRKRSATEDDEDDSKAAKRKRKEEKREKKRAEKAAKGKKRQDPEREKHVALDTQGDEPSTRVAPPEILQPVKVQPRYRAHRARNLASKRLAAASATGMNEILGIASSGPTSGTSSIPFPTQEPPSRRSIWDAAAEDAGPSLGLARTKNRTEHVEDRGADQISAMGLGMRTAFGGGLGFGGAKDESVTNDTVRSAGDDILRKSGKSVAEYFAEKMRLKGVGKGGQGVAAIESGEETRKKTKG